MEKYRSNLPFVAKVYYDWFETCDTVISDLINLLFNLKAIMHG